MNTARKLPVTNAIWNEVGPHLYSYENGMKTFWFVLPSTPVVPKLGDREEFLEDRKKLLKLTVCKVTFIDC